MRAASTLLAAGLALAPLAAPRPATAQQDELHQAEQAYLQVDFQATLQHAHKALEAGGHSHRELVRIYQLVGISAAALDRGEEARDAYVRMLALDPEHEVDRNLAPRLRSPFLEARGYWTARSDRLEASVELDRDDGGLRVALTDPLDMAEAVILRARPAGAPSWSEVRVPALGAQLVPIEGVAEADRVQYALEVHDAWGNRLIEQGTVGSPRELGRLESSPTAGTEGPAEGSSIFESPIFWGVVGAFVVGATIGIVVAASNTSVGAQTDVSIGIR